MSEETQKRLVNKKLQYNTLQTYRTEKLILRSKQRYYELGERSHKILAWQLRTEQASKIINAIRTDSNKITYKPLEINETFKNFYSKLYQSESQNDEIEIERFLAQISLPRLNSEEQKGLDLPFTNKEIEDALGSLQSNKSPGEDGFPPEFYKRFKDLLIPLFMELLVQVERTHKLPESFSTAILIVLPKKDRDLLDPASYRPISLLNTDYKIIAKMLSNRLSKYLPKLVHDDQTGFIKNRQSVDNITRLLSLIHLAQKRQETSMAIALDAEKAFDRLEWDFLFKVLGKYGLGPTFINWIKTLNASPKAKVVTNNQISPSFHLTRSARQGCPLSPALFILAIEPLAELIRMDPDIKGFTVNQEEYKINLFADDVLVYLTNPFYSLRKLSFRLEEYGKVSGYKVNWDKSEILPFTEGDYTQCRSLTHFRWPTNGIKYLGIRVDNNIMNLYKLNYLPLLRKIQEDLDKWMMLPITLIGRVNAVKMNIFPRLQYLFQMLPIKLPQKFFKELNKSVRKFLWKGKMSRISLEKLTWKFNLGGLQLPNFKNYYKANQLSFIASFFSEIKPAWIKIELHKLGEKVPEEFIYKWDSKWMRGKDESFILKHLIELWNATNMDDQTKKSLLAKRSLFQNRLVPFTMNNQILNNWFQKGIKHIEDCFQGSKLMSFDQLKHKYKISNNTFFCYLQLRAYLREELGQTMLLPKPTEIEILIHKGKIKKFTSRMYNLIQEQTIKQGIHQSRQKWETDLNTKIDEVQWSRLCLDSMTNTINVRLRLVQYNFLHQLYITPQKINRFNPNLSAQCFRCNQEIGTFLHSTWSCPKVQPFWTNLRVLLEQIIHVQLPHDPILFLLSDIERMKLSNKLNKYQIVFLKIALAVAKKAIAASWKLDACLTIERWNNEILSCIPLEKITYNLRNKYETFTRIWSPYLQKIGSNI